MTTRLSNHVQALAIAIEERHSLDLAHRFCSAGRVEVPFASASELLRRASALAEAIAAHSGTRDHAAAVGSVLAALYLVGDDTLPDPQMSLLSDQWAGKKETLKEELPGGDDEEGDDDGGGDADPDESPGPKARPSRRRHA